MALHLPGLGKRGSLNEPPFQKSKFETLLVQKPRSTYSSLEVIFVHGCPSSHSGLCKSLRKTALKISQDSVPCRVHIFSYNAAKVFARGKSRYQQISRDLMLRMKTLVQDSPKQALGIVSHNSAIWLVQEAILLLQYESREQIHVPVGIATVALSSELHDNQINASTWSLFRDKLLRHLMPSATKKSLTDLDYNVVEASVEGFEKLQKRLEKTQQPIIYRDCTQLGERQNRSVLRTGTAKSDDSGSSSLIRQENNPTMFVGITEDERLEIVRFLGAISNISPAKFPLFSTPEAFKLDRRQSTLSARTVLTEGSKSQHGSPRPQSTEWDKSSNIANRAGQGTSHVDAQVAIQSLLAETKYKQSLVLGGLESSRSRHMMRVSSQDLLPTGLHNTIGSDPVSVLKLAEWYFDIGELAEAEKLYASLLDDDKGSPWTPSDHYQIRLCHAQIKCITGWYLDSEAQLEALLSDLTSKKDCESKLVIDTGRWLALAQWRQGNYDVAERTVETCRKIEPGYEDTPTLLSTLALILASAGRFGEAWSYSQKVIYPSQAGQFLEESLKTDVDRREFYRKSLEISDYRACLFNHACILSELGRFKEADVANSVALENMEEMLGTEHFITLDAASLRAWLLVFDSSTENVGKEVQRNLRAMRECRGKTHPSTLQSLQTLVLMYKAQGRYSDAEETARYLVASSESSYSLRPDHPQTLKSKSILAEILLSTGKWDEAEDYQRKIIRAEPNQPLYEIGLATILRVRGKWDIARETAVGGLLELLIRLGKEEKGESGKQTDLFANEKISVRDLMRILNLSGYIKSQLEGPKLSSKLEECFDGLQAVRVYPSLAQALHCVALCEQVRDTADLAFVQALLEKLHDVFDERLGSHHRHTISVGYDLAVNRRLRGNLKEGLELIESVISERKSLLGTDHPDYLIAKHQRAVTLLRLGKLGDALSEQSTTLSAQEYLLGKDHADTILSRYTLAAIYCHLNRCEDAERLIVLVIEDQTHKLAAAGWPEGVVDSHPIILRSRARYALILMGLHKYDEAIREQNIICKWRARAPDLGEQHDLTLSARNDLAQIKQAAGRLQDAQEEYQSLLVTFESVRKSKHLNPEVRENFLEFEVRSNLASCYFELQDYEQAEEIQQDLLDKLQSMRHGKRKQRDREIAAMFNLALTRKITGQLDSEDGKVGALELLKNAVKIARYTLGDDHPQVAELTATFKTWIKEARPRPSNSSRDLEGLYDRFNGYNAALNGKKMYVG